MQPTRTAMAGTTILAVLVLTPATPAAAGPTGVPDTTSVAAENHRSDPESLRALAGVLHPRFTVAPLAARR
ncbi:hypothetical protein ACVCAH_30810 [Micromonospora sp. LZ34]